MYEYTYIQEVRKILTDLRVGTFIIITDFMMNENLRIEVYPRKQIPSLPNQKLQRKL